MVEGGGILAGSAFSMSLQGTGDVALATVGKPVVLECNQPTYVDANSVVAWSAGLEPTVTANTSTWASILGGTGEGLQLAFQGGGFVVVQPHEWEPVQRPSSGPSNRDDDRFDDRFGDRDLSDR